MKMKQVCPHCGSEDYDYQGTDTEYEGDQIYLKTTGRCSACGKKFIIDEIFELASRIYAKDEDELDKMIREELQEGR